MPTAFAVAAHPDDIEFLMAGTLMLLGEKGFELHYMNVSSGGCGSTKLSAESTARVRREEGKAAAASIGAVFHESIAEDLRIFYSERLLARLTAVVREVAPEILLTHSPVDYMEDHTNTCRLAVTAAFSRGVPNFVSDPPRAHITGPVTIYHAQPYGNRDPLRQLITPDLFVDTSDVIERKAAMLACHDSQRSWLRETQGLDSYLQTMADLDAEVGRMSGLFAFAEGWRRHLHLGFCGPDDDPLRKALAEKAFVLS